MQYAESLIRRDESKGRLAILTKGKSSMAKSTVNSPNKIFEVSVLSPINPKKFNSNAVQTLI